MNKLIFGIIIFCIFIFYFTRPTTIQVVSDIDSLYELYNSVNNTMPSKTNHIEIVTIIEERLYCYERSADFTWRSKICNGEYVTDLVHVGRESFQSSPDIENFLNTVSSCPIIFNMCSSMDSLERCIEFERQCIDLAFDKHWRGNIFNIREIQ